MNRPIYSHHETIGGETVRVLEGYEATEPIKAAAAMIYGTAPDLRPKTDATSAAETERELLERERTARIAAQSELAELKEALAKSGLAHRRAVQEAVREAVAEEREACAYLCEAACLDIGFKGVEAIDAVGRTRDVLAASIRTRGAA